MKKLGFLLFCDLVGFLPSCDKCDGCQKDVTIDACVENSIPYEVGDTVMFRSNLDDTLVFICSERKYYQYLLPPKAGNSYECCTPFESENLSAKLESADASLDILTQFISIDYDLNISLVLNGEKKRTSWYACTKGGGWELNSITLAQHTFHKVIGLHFDNATDSLYLNSEDQFGVVGFKVDGVEWAKID